LLRMRSCRQQHPCRQAEYSFHPHLLLAPIMPVPAAKIRAC
jgi:hypothetical protein